jgi:G2/mitotic-specific cyclin 1/2
MEENGLDFLQYKILVDYVIKTHKKLKIEFGLWDDTLFTAMSIVNRYLSQKKAIPEELELLALASIVISMKYNEGIIFRIEDFIEVLGSNFDVDELKRAERYVLKVIDYVVDTANPYEFLRRCNSAEGYNDATRHLAKYLLELTIDSNFVDIKPSLLAAASIFLSRKIQGKNEWGENEINFCGYTKDELSQTVKQMEKRLSEPGIENEFVYNKYKTQAQYVAERM